MPVRIHPRVWLNWLMPPVTKLEKKIFEAVIAASEEKYRDILKRQVASFNYAQRSPQWRDAMFYCSYKGIRTIETGEPIKVKNESKGSIKGVRLH